MDKPKKLIITIAGKPGSGKSTTAKTVAKELGYQHFSSGGLFRQLADEKGIDVLQANLSAEQNSEIDYLVDGKLQELGKQKNKIVIDSRTAWHWIPDSFKVFLDLSIEVGAKRILKTKSDRKSANEDIPNDLDEYKEDLQKRLESENLRYKKLYDINPSDLGNYDLVVDTDENNVKQVVAIIIEKFNHWQKS